MEKVKSFVLARDCENNPILFQLAPGCVAGEGDLIGYGGELFKVAYPFFVFPGELVGKALLDVAEVRKPESVFCCQWRESDA